MLQIDFEFETAYGAFRDALHLPEDHGLSEAEIQAMKQQRLDNWIAILTNPPTEEPTPVQEPAATITISGEEYTRLDGTPLSGAKLIEVNGVWYFKV